MELRKCCNHPYLVKGAEAEIAKHFIDDSPLEVRTSIISCLRVLPLIVVDVSVLTIIRLYSVYPALRLNKNISPSYHFSSLCSSDPLFRPLGHIILPSLHLTLPSSCPLHNFESPLCADNGEILWEAHAARQAATETES